MCRWQEKYLVADAPLFSSLCLPVCLHLCFCLREEIMQFWKPVSPLMNQQFSSAFDVSFIIQASSCPGASFLFSRTIFQTGFSLLLSNQMDLLILQSSVDAPHSLVITEIAWMAWGVVTPLTRDSRRCSTARLAYLQRGTLSLPSTCTLTRLTGKNFDCMLSLTSCVTVLFCFGCLPRD